MLEIMTNETEAAARIIVIGVGGAGNNAVNRMVEETDRRSRIYRCEHGQAGTEALQGSDGDPDRREADQRTGSRCKA